MPAKMHAIHCAEAKNGRGIPEFFLPAEAVHALIEAGQATWGHPKNMTWVKLKKTKNEIPKTARSLKPGLSVIEGYIEGKSGDVEIVDIWASGRWRDAA